MKITRQFLFLMVLFGLIACTSVHYVAPGNFTATKPELVEMLYQEPSRPYEVIAFVEARTVFIWDTPEKMMSECREEAAKVGADAIIFSSTGHAAALMISKIAGTPPAALIHSCIWETI